MFTPTSNSPYKRRRLEEDSPGQIGSEQTERIISFSGYIRAIPSNQSDESMTESGESNSHVEESTADGLCTAFCHSGIFMWRRGTTHHEYHCVPTKLAAVVKRYGASTAISFVALNPENLTEFYIQFTDGRRDWYFENQGLSELVRDRNISYIALGGDASFYLRLEDGSEYYNLPSRLTSGLCKRPKHLPPIRYLTLDERKGYWVKFEDGNTWCGDINDVAQETIDELDPEYLTLGPIGDFFLVTNGEGKWRACPCNQFHRRYHLFVPSEHCRGEEDGDEINYHCDINRNDSGEQSYQVDAWIDPNEIRFTQSSISQHFQDGRTIHQMLQDLRQEHVHVGQIPPIQVVKGVDCYWSVDNRRLWVYRKAQLDEVPVNIIHRDPIVRSKLISQGRSIKVRQ
ncbi:hypothetical protein AKO1_009605 [Acrasis kona]|uniref:Uncharacterized protein n=1 Tax=Acrasis kona TaxID=1008807 RepID=A0AAW2ZPA0_9EUKA